MDARLIVQLARFLACAAILGSPWTASAQTTDTTPASVGVERASDLGPWTRGDRLATKLRTPRSALEAFLDAGDDERFDEAARVLNLSDLPMSDRVDLGPDLAEKLHFVLDRRLDVDWRQVPDRPDGARDTPTASVEGEAVTVPAPAPAPRQNLRVGEISGDTAPVEIRLERVQTPGMPPVWLIARSTVRSIDALYELHGPGWFDRNGPDWALARFAAVPVWQWLGFILFVLLSVAVAMGLERLVLRSTTSSKRRHIRGLGRRVARPLAVLASVSLLWLATDTLLSLSGWVSTTVTALFVVAITWLAVNTANALSEFIVDQWLGGWAESDGQGTQRRRTNLSVARRAIVFVTLLVGLAIAMAQFEAFRTVGTSLLASAGVAGIILGVAAQDSLSNVVAGMQIALTQLIRIGDTVYVEENWGTVEDVTFTYVIIRTWDQRRIAVPNRHIISHPLENWAMTQTNMILPVILHVDYRTPIEVLRRRYVEVLEAADDWDREQAPRLQVIDATENTLRVRMLCSAKDGSTAWDLHCHIREELVAFLRDWDDGRYLPRSRMRIEGTDALAEESP